MSALMLDTIIGIVIMLSVVIAFFRGFVREALTVANLIGAAAAAWFFGPRLTNIFADWLGGSRDSEDNLIWGAVPPEVMANFLSHATVFFSIFLILMLAGMSISTGVKALGLGPLDRILGMVFGAARGALLVFLIYLPFGALMDPQKYPDWAKDSVSVGALDSAYVWVDEYLEEEKEEARKEKAMENAPTPPDSMEGKLQKMKKDVETQEDDYMTAPGSLTPQEQEILQ